MLLCFHYIKLGRFCWWYNKQQTSFKLFTFQFHVVFVHIKSILTFLFQSDGCPIYLFVFENILDRTNSELKTRNQNLIKSLVDYDLIQNFVLHRCPINFSFSDWLKSDNSNKIHIFGSVLVNRRNQKHQFRKSMKWRYDLIHIDYRYWLWQLD